LSSDEQERIGFKPQMMSFDIYKKAIDSIAALPAKPKALIFAGHGEPLTNPKIAEMIAYAKSQNSAGRTEIVTNGLLLNREISDALIAAGLDRLRISLQGITASDYKRVCDTNIDFSNFIDSIRYFYINNEITDLFVKIIDIALAKSETAEMFHKLFDPICDTAEVEHLFPFIEQIDHSKLADKLTHTKHGDYNAVSVNICPMPFYMLVVLPNGNVTCCCSIEPPIVLGNIMRESLLSIWLSEKRRVFLRTLIDNRRENPICAKCTVPDYGIQENDNLDEYREKLMNLYQEELTQ
jgi:radical SAM protein with 4Fe4S-binding SPASM domain